MPSYSPPISWLKLFTEAASQATIIQDNDTLQPRDVDKIANSCMFFLAELSSMKINIRSFNTETFALQGNKRVYTFGIGGDFNSPRPLEITNAQLLLTPSYVSSISQELKIWGKDLYYTLSDYLSTTGPPDILFPEYTFPLATLAFYGIPDQSYSVVITSTKELSFQGQLTDKIMLEDAYLPVLLNGLTLRICSKFGKIPTAEVKEAYAKALGQLTDLGWVEPIMQSNFPGASTISSGTIVNPFPR